MLVFEPVRTIVGFRSLDEGEILEGYLDAFSSQQEPAAFRSRSYWHGWRNAMIESQQLLPDSDYEALAAEFSAIAMPAACVA